MNHKRFLTQRSVLASLLAVPVVLFAPSSEAITCPANSTEDRLVWDDVWTGANSNQYGVDQTFTSESGAVDFVISITNSLILTAPPLTPACDNSQFLLFDRSTYYEALIPGQGDTISLHMDWPHRLCQTQFRVSAFLADTATPFDLFQLEYSLYDIDVAGTTAPFPWSDLIRYDPAPANRFNGAGSDFVETATISQATINNCTNASFADLERCRQTVSWSGPLNQFNFNYESGPNAPDDPIAQRIFISDIEFCSPNRPDLSVVKTEAPDPVRRGENLIYTLTITNSPTADGASTDSVVQDVLPADVTWVSTTNSNGGGTCTVATPTGCNCPLPGNSGTVSCNVGNIPVAGTRTVTITTRVN